MFDLAIKIPFMGPAFNRMWASSIVSNLADGVMVAAVPLLAISLTDSPVLIAAIGAMVMLPWLLFAIPIGVMVDRVDRRYILAGSNATRSFVVGLLAFGCGVHYRSLRSRCGHNCAISNTSNFGSKRF